MKKLLARLHNVFIPHKGNGYWPSFFGKSAITAIVAVIILLEIAYITQTFIVFRKTNFLAAVLPSVLTALTNEVRAENYAPALAENSLLSAAAKKKAEDMAARGYFSHTDPDGKLPWYWLNSVGYKYSYAGENLAVNFLDSEDVSRAWMESLSHRANIVKKEFTEIGIGVATGTFNGRESVFVVEFFGTPRMEAAVPTPETLAVKVKSAAITPAKPKVLGEETSSVSAQSTGAIKEISQIRSFMERLLSSPRTTAAYAYGMLALLISIALSLAVFIKIRIQHPRLIRSAIAVMALIAVISFANLSFTSLSLKLPENGNAASVIEALP
ncbi:MAG: CAP domain-containing protein [Patescibacteria group bacterium]